MYKRYQAVQKKSYQWYALDLNNGRALHYCSRERANFVAKYLNNNPGVFAPDSYTGS